MRLHVKIVLTIIVTLLLLIYLAGFLPVFSQAPTNWVITGRVMAPSPETTENIAVTNAIITLIDIQGDIHIVSTGEDGYYFFKNLAVDANCVITAIAIVNGNTMVFKDVIPQPVLAHETYDAGTADARSTALALIVEELIEQGLTYEDIDLEIIQDSENFEIVEEHVFSVLEDNGNIMDDIVVAGEEVVSEETLESTEADAPDIEATDEEGKLYKVTVTLREKISDDDLSPDTAAQTRDTYTINASFVGSGSIDPSGTVTVNHGSSQTFTITPDPNYHILGITIDGALDVGPFVSPYTYTFDNVTDEHTIEAYLAIDNYAIAVIVGNNGSISPSGAVTVNHGSNQTFTITPDLNYHILGITIDGALDVGPFVSPYTYPFTNVTDGHSIEASFAMDTYKIAVIVGNNGSISPSGAVSVNHGSSKTFTITPTTGYHISEVLVDGSSVEAESPYTFSNVTENHNITAFFAINTFTLTMETGGTGAGTVTIDPVKENYDHGDVVTITATADAISSTFSGWNGDAFGTGDVTLTMDSDKSVTATFTLKKVTLTVDVAGTGSGKVSPTVGVHTYNYGELVTIGATPDTGSFASWISSAADIGSVFSGWSGDASGTGDLTLIMDSDKSVTAIFTKKRTVTLTVAVTGSGSGTVIPAVGVYTYNYGDVVNIGATPDTASATWVSDKADPGSVFTGWSGDALGTGDVTLIMDSDKLITATFTLQEVTLTMEVTGTGSGSVSPTEGVHTYNYGETVTIKATADPSSDFDGWSGDTSGTSDVTLTMDSDKSVTAPFTLKIYTITATAGSNGSFSPSGSVTVDHGAGQSFSITPTTNYHIDDVLVDGNSVSVGEDGKYTFTDVTADHIISASFAIDTYTITATPGSGGSFSPSGSVTVDHGADQSFTITPDPNYHISGITVDGTLKAGPFVSPYTFNNITTGHTIAASFAINTYTITATAGSGGSFSPSGSVTVDHGAGQSFSITPTTNYHIDDVLVDGNSVSVGEDGKYIFTDVTADHIISASFAIDTYTITATPGSNGSFSPSEVTVDHGADQTFTITPDPNYHISGITVDGTPKAGPFVSPYTFNNITTGHTIAASFAINTYTITASTGANGSIDPSGEVIVVHDSSKTFNIDPDDNYHIDDVLVDGNSVSVGEDGKYTFTDVTADHIISATFAIDTYTITATPGSGGSFSPSGDVTVDHGLSKSFTITPDPNYHISGITVDGTPKAGPFVSSYTFNNVTAGHIISATFAIDTYTITATPGSGGSFSPSGEVTVNYGSDQSFAITPTIGYHIADVVVDSSSVGAVTSYTFTDVTAGHTISASFNPAAVSFAVTTENLGTETAGTAFSVTITAKDIEGNTATGYTGSHNIIWTWTANNSPNETEPTMAGTADLDFSAGAVTVTGFILTNSSETPTITATATGAAGTTPDITVNAGALASFTFDAVGAQIAGIEFSVDLSAAVDSYGNAVTGSYNIAWSSNATNSPNDTPPTMAGEGNQTFTAGAVVNVEGFILTNSGETPSITATIGSASDTSSIITVTASTLDQFTFAYIDFAVSGTKEEGKPAKTKPFFITIYAKDESENTVTDYTGTGTLTLINYGTGYTFPYIYANKVVIQIYDKAGTEVNFSDGIDGVWTGEVVIGASSATLLGLPKGDPNAFVYIKITTDNDTTGVSNKFIVTD